MAYAIRYRPDTDLGRRFAGHSQPYHSHAAAERVREGCVNGDAMETIEIDEEAS